MKHHGWISSFLLLLFLAQASLADSFTHYYEIKPDFRPANNEENSVQASEEVDPLSHFAISEFGGIAGLSLLKEQFVRLLEFQRVDQAWGRPRTPYKRERDFGGWMRWAGTGSCLNTRGHVLVRESLEPVAYDSRGCLVTEGNWWDPYTDQIVKSPRDLQIDHFVPLKNAYVSGAEEWSRVDRCVYANFMGANYHLIPVWGPENSKKSDKTIAEYLPPNANYRCQYLAQWLKIKLAWNLKLNPYEVETAQAMIRRKECDQAEFVMSESELRNIKAKIVETRAYCQR